MFRTVFEADRDSVAHARKVLDISNGNVMHRLLTGILDKGRAEAHILYDISRKDGFLYIIVHSDIPLPEDSLEEYGYRHCLTKNISDELAALQNGDVICLEVNVCPRVSEHGRKHYISDEGRRIEWFRQQMYMHGGLVIPQEMCREVAKTSQSFSKENGVKTTFPVSRMVAVAKITEKDKMLECFRNGIGGFKNYGTNVFTTKNFFENREK